MTKSEFMKELEDLLMNLSTEEREAALTYYDDYFEDAGPDNVERVIIDLGTPQRVAAIIKSDMNNVEIKDYDKIIYTENGYKDTTIEEDKYEVVRNENQPNYEEGTFYSQNKDNTDSYNSEKDYNNTDNNTNSTEYNSKNPQRNQDSTSKIILIVILCIIAIPVGVPIIATAFGLFTAVIGTLFGLFVALAAIAISFLVAGIVLFIAGIVKLFILPIDGVLMCGAGLILFGLGTLAAMLTIIICTRVIPVLVRGFVNLCKLPFVKRGVSR